MQSECALWVIQITVWKSNSSECMRQCTSLAYILYILSLQPPSLQSVGLLSLEIRMCVCASFVLCVSSWIRVIQIRLEAISRKLQWWAELQFEVLVLSNKIFFKAIAFENSSELSGGLHIFLHAACVLRSPMNTQPDWYINSGDRLNQYSRQISALYTHWLSNTILPCLNLPLINYMN